MKYFGHFCHQSLLHLLNLILLRLQTLIELSEIRHSLACVIWIGNFHVKCYGRQIENILLLQITILRHHVQQIKLLCKQLVALHMIHKLFRP